MKTQVSIEERNHTNLDQLIHKMNGKRFTKINYDSLFHYDISMPPFKNLKTMYASLIDMAHVGTSFQQRMMNRVLFFIESNIKLQMVTNSFLWSLNNHRNYKNY
jgi:hypothetical protein